MALLIARIGTPTAADTTSVAIPTGHQIGDLIILFAFHNALTIPTTVAGWTTLNSGSSGATAWQLAWKIAQSSSEVSGTWTNATGLVCSVYRNTATNKTPIKNIGASTSTGTSIGYNISFLMGEYGTSWIVAVAATKTIDSTIETAPDTLVNQVDLVGASVEYVLHDSNGIYATTKGGAWPNTTVSVAGTSAEWRSYVFEILAEQQGNLENYKAFKGGNGLSFGERIK